MKELDKAVGDVNRAEVQSGEDLSPEELLKKIEEV